MRASSNLVTSGSRRTARPWCGSRSALATCTRERNGSWRACRLSAPRYSPGGSPATAPWPTPWPSPGRSRQRTASKSPRRAVWLRALMSELERLANHFGDIGAICNDAAFAMMHAHCGYLREQVLRVADRCFGHRLMMDQVVPGGVRTDLHQDGKELIRALLKECRRRFPELVELYDNTASLQDRTVGTGILSATLARQFGCGGYVGRASGRSFDARRSPGYPPYDAAAIRRTGPGRRRCGRQSLDPHPRGRTKHGLDRSDPAATPVRAHRRCPRPPCPRRARAKAWRWWRAFAATCWSGSGQEATAPSSAAICVIPRGSSGRCSRPRSKATSSPTSLCATSPSIARTRAMTSSGTAHA